MEALMLVAASATLLPEFKQTLATAFPTASITDTSNEHGFVIEFSATSRVWIEDYGSNLESIGWDEQEVCFIKKTLPINYQVYSLAYHGIEAAKKVIIHLANSNEMLVDNDFGTLMVGADFVCKVINEPAWNWYEDLE
jgi:hypothetical protein